MKQRKSKAPEQVNSVLERVLSSLNLGIKVKQYGSGMSGQRGGDAIARQTRPGRYAPWFSG